MTKRDVTTDVTGRSGGWRRALHSVRVQMALLTVVLALLIGLAITLLIIMGYRNYRESTELQLTQTANALSLAFDGRVREAAGVLQSLALSPQLAANNLRAFDRLARRTVKGPDQWVALVDDRGFQQVNTAVPPGARLPAAPMALFRSFQEKGAGTDLYVTDLVPSAMTGRLVVGVFMPLLQPGRPIRYLEIVLVPSVLQQVFAEQKLPPGWYGSLHDRETRVIVRSNHSTRYLGRRSSVLANIELGDQGVFPGRSLEGYPVLTAYKQSRFTGWILTVSMPQTAVRAALVQSLALTVALTLGLLLLGWSLVWWVGGRYARAIGKLAQAATVLGEGAAIKPTATGLSEIDAVGLAMHEAFVSLKRREGEAREYEAKIRRLVEANIIGIALWTRDGRVTEANEALLDLLGYDRDDLRSGRICWTEMTPAEWWDATQGCLEELKATGRCQPFEKEFFHKDGRRVPVLLGAATFSGAPEEGVAFVLDLTEQKQVEERQRVMVEELNHRVKNNLATVLSLAMQTAKSADDVKAFMSAFTGRLQALSKINELLVRHGWGKIALKEVLATALRRHLDEGVEFMPGSPQSTTVSARAAVSLCLVLNEMAVNAVLHGALGAEGGRVEIAWSEPDPDHGVLTWTERPCRPITRPIATDISATLIQRLTTGDLGGRADLDFRPEGLTATLTFALKGATA